MQNSSALRDEAIKLSEKFSAKLKPNLYKYFSFSKFCEEQRYSIGNRLDEFF